MELNSAFVVNLFIFKHFIIITIVRIYLLSQMFDSDDFQLNYIIKQI